MNKKHQVFKTYAGVGKHRVDMTLMLVGHDVVAIISGGDRPHVGAVAIAVPRPSLRDSSRVSSTSSVFTLVSHKDDAVARAASEELASKLDRVAVVSAGAHVDNASKADIRKLVKNAEEAVKKAIEISTIRK